jgi:hypothetical protein
MNPIQKNLIDSYQQFQNNFELLNKSVDLMLEGKLFKEDVYDLIGQNFDSKKIDKSQLDNLIKKALNIHNLTPVRRRVVTRDGRIYTKTVYVKKQEVDTETSRKFNSQANFEREAAEGSLAKVKFKGSSTGTIYETDKLNFLRKQDGKLYFQFTDDFATNNANNYVYRRGTEISIPSIDSDDWDGTLYAEPPAPPQPAAPERELVNSTDQVQLGDKLLLVKGTNEIKGTLQYIYRAPDGSVYLRVKKEDGTITEPKLNSRTQIFKLNENVSPPGPDLMTVQGIKVLMAEGIKIDFITDRMRVQDGMRTETYRARADATGRENPRGRSFANFTRQVPNYVLREPNDQDIQNKLNELSRSENFKTLAKMNILELKNDIERVLSQKLNLSGMKFNIFEDGFTAQVGLDFKMTRKIQNQGKEVEHTLFRIDSRIQDSGAGKAFFRALNKQYRKADIESISVHANITVGGYAWASYGFRSSKYTADEFVDKIRRNIGNTYNIKGNSITITDSMYQEAKSSVESFYINRSNSEPFPLNLISSMQNGMLGKAVMLGSNWWGRINLRDPEQRDHFENYIGFTR